MTPSSVRSFGRAADGALAAAIVLAPIAGGSSHLVVLPILAVLASIAAGATILGVQGKERELRIPGLVIGLFLLAALTAAQLVPLPEALLPGRAVALRDFVDDGLTLRPLSYEPAATAREAAKLVILALIALAAAERTRAAGRFRHIAIMVVTAGLASAAIALVHRALGAERMLGVIPTLRAPHDLVTTFVNPNHASGFMTLSALTALGLALSVKHRRPKVGWFAAAATLASVAVLGFSRGGLIALAIGVGAMLVALLRVRTKDGTQPRFFVVPPALVVGVSGVVTAVVLWRLNDFARQFAGGPADPLSIAGKVAAMKDAWPMIVDHAFTGIGRGSYISAYAAYKTYSHQFTFSHPENLVVQALSDWGLIVGSIAVVGLFASIAHRFWAARSIVAAAALAGVIAVTAQNFVDFSLEILGVSIAVAAILGGCGLSIVRTVKVPTRAVPLTLLVIAPLLILVPAAFWLGDLDEDHTALSAIMKGSEPRLADAELNAFARRHPANAAMAAKRSYLSETHEPLDRTRLGDALRWANRALYLDPNYADAHLASGRILVRAGYRDQGFGAMGRAWALASDGLLADGYIVEILRLAETPLELARALPSEQTNPGRLDGLQLTRLLGHLQKRGENERGVALLQEIAPKLRELPPNVLFGIADVARRLGAERVAMALLTRRAQSMPGDARGTLLLFDLQMKRGELELAQETLERGLAAGPLDPLPFHRRAFDLALRQTDLPTARTALERLRASMTPTDQNQVMALQLESKLELAEGRLGHAIAALDGAVRLSPTATGLRIDRARVAIRLGRPRDAQSDLEAVLRLDPSHAEGKRLRAELEAVDRRVPQAP